MIGKAVGELSDRSDRCLNPAAVVADAKNCTRRYVSRVRVQLTSASAIATIIDLVCPRHRQMPSWSASAASKRLVPARQPRIGGQPVAAGRAPAPCSRIAGAVATACSEINRCARTRDHPRARTAIKPTLLAFITFALLLLPLTDFILPP